jgi:CBS domain-containing protein
MIKRSATASPEAAVSREAWSAAHCPTREGCSMLASELQISIPTVNRRTPAVVAARLIAKSRLGAVVLADDDGTPAAVVAAPDILRLLLREEAADDENGATIGNLLDDDGARIGSILRIDAGADLAEVAVRMSAARAQIAVVDSDPRSPRFILLPLVLDAVLATRDDGGAP